MNLEIRFVRRVAGAALLATIAITTDASAQEYCVTCSEPSATYRCVVTDARPGLSQSLQLVCLQALARDGQHSSCAVKRGVTVFECDAPVKRISAGQPAAVPVPGAAAGPGASAGPVVLVPVPPPAADPNAPPKTLLEAAQRAKDASDQQWKQSGENAKAAGNATAGFFKKTFECFGSLFTRCGTPAP
jgi:hypothetical protein